MAARTPGSVMMRPPGRSRLSASISRPGTRLSGACGGWHWPLPPQPGPFPPGLSRPRSALTSPNDPNGPLPAGRAPWFLRERNARIAGARPSMALLHRERTFSPASAWSNGRALDTTTRRYLDNKVAYARLTRSLPIRPARPGWRARRGAGRKGGGPVPLPAFPPFGETGEKTAQPSQIPATTCAHATRARTTPSSRRSARCR